MCVFDHFVYFSNKVRIVMFVYICIYICMCVIDHFAYFSTKLWVCIVLCVWWYIESKFFFFERILTASYLKFMYLKSLSRKFNQIEV
jgi:hypothetical protein